MPRKLTQSDIKLIYELIYKNPNKLNEDLLSDLEEDDDEDDSDFIIDNTIVKIFKGKPTADFMNRYNNAGDLLTYNMSNNLFYIIKNNKDIDEIRENLNTEYYGKIIGMCVGKGLWMSTEFDYTVKYSWATLQTKLYREHINTSDDGWYNTTYILNNYSKQCDDTVWLALYEQEITGLGKHVCYLPSLNQMNEIWKNNDIVKILASWYWSSSQDIDYKYAAYDVTFRNGDSSYSKKYGFEHIFMLIHFE